MFYGFIEGNYKLVSRYTISRFILVNDVGITQFYDSRISIQETEQSSCYKRGFASGTINWKVFTPRDLLNQL